MQLYEEASEELTGTVDFRHMHVDMSNTQVSAPFGGGNTCRAAMGYRYARVPSSLCPVEFEWVWVGV